jgi:alcohol dehydrogenase class IV
VTHGFTWRDGERTIRFGRGAIADAVETLGGEGYALLTTERAAAMAPGVVEGAAGVHMLGDGYVDELAGELLGAVARERVVALGGGRVVDTAKALAAASGGTQVAMAVPTTLSGAEMTRIHRRAAGADQRAPTVRARVVVNDPDLSASQPLADLAASALNALRHAAEGPCTPLANPVATLAAHDGARLLARSLMGSDPSRVVEGSPPDREGLALGALLAGYVIDSTGYGLHHVLSQTLVRLAGASHGQANAVLLCHTIGALAWRFPQRIDALGVALEDDPSDVAARMCRLTGATRLRDIGVERAALAECAEAASGRPELDLTAPRADRAELLALYEGAW